MRSKSKKIVPLATSSDKLALVRSGKKKKTVTGFKENKNITFSNKEGKFVAVEKEKKFEEAGVAKKKQNYIMFESILGTEKERDTHKIEGARNKGKPGERMEEVLVCKKKRKEYLDNYQYLETKDIRESQPATVIHERLGDIVGGVYEETSYEKVRSWSSNRNRGGGVNSSSSYSSTLRTGGGYGGPSSSVSATQSRTEVTRVGRRGGAGGAFGTTTTSTNERTTTRGGGVSSTATRSTSRVANY